MLMLNSERIDKGEYGIFPSKYESLSYSDTTAKSSDLKASFYWERSELVPVIVTCVEKGENKEIVNRTMA